MYSLGVGDRISASSGVGSYHGTSSAQDLQNLRRDLQTKIKQGLLAARMIGGRPIAYVKHGWLQIDWPYHDQGWGNAAPRSNEEMRTIVGITDRDPFWPNVLTFFGLPANTRITNGWNVTTTHSSGGFNLDLSHINIDPGQLIKQLDPHIDLDPGDLLHKIGIPTPDDMLHKLGLPSLGKILNDAGIPTDPADLFKDIVDPARIVTQLVEHLPGIREIAKYIPAMPDPTQIAMSIVQAAMSGDLNKLKTAVLDVGHELADVLSMVPGIGSGIAGPLDAAIELLESGSALRAALDLLLEEIPDIPPDVREIFLRPAIDAVSDIIDRGKSVSDAFLSAFKQGVMAEANARGFPAQLVGIISNLIDAVIQVILEHKPLDQAATGLAQQGLENAMTAAIGQTGTSAADMLKQLPSIPGGSELLKQLPSIPGGSELLKKLPAMPARSADIIKQIESLPGGADLLKKIPSSTELAGQLTRKTFEAVKYKIPADVQNKVSSLEQSYQTVKNVANNSNTIHALSRGILALARQDPNKKNPTIQKKIADLRTAIASYRAKIRSGATRLDNLLGEAPTAKLLRLKLGNPAPPPPKKVLSLKLEPATPPAPALRYPPYPKQGAVHGLGAPGRTLGDASGRLYFAYVTQPEAAGWVAISPSWQTVAELIDTMSQTISSNPAASFEFGGYVWDGQSMHWQPLASLVPPRAVA